jgi:C1A family cysteine protease
VNSHAQSASLGDNESVIDDGAVVDPSTDNASWGGGIMTKFKLGWRRDLPDIRDFDPSDSSKVTAGLRSAKQKTVADYLERKTKSIMAEAAAKPAVDLTAAFSPVENQGDLGSCTANAGVALLEYYERRAFNTFIDASRLFLYKVTRNLDHFVGDTGAYLRTTMRAMALFGVPPEERMPYVISKFENEPSAFDYAYASNYQSVSYFRLDQPGLHPQVVLDRIKAYAGAGFPSMFGFTVYNFGNAQGEFAFPSPTDRSEGGHAVVVAGYDDTRVIGNTKGALKIRNSWGTGWGTQGYGWLPYEYVLRGLAVDFWSLFRAEYIGNGQFQ